MIPLFILLAQIFCNLGEITEASFSDKQAGQVAGQSNDYESLELCDEPDMDDVIIVNDVYYVFKKHFVWIQEKENVSWSYNFKRHLINDIFPKMESDIDAAFSDENNDVYFFKDVDCWKYKPSPDFAKFQLYSGYPQVMHKEFPGIPFDLDAATKVPESVNGYIYFFKDDLYYRFEPKSVPHIRSTYPKLIERRFHNTYNNLNGCVYDPKREVIYFFRGYLYKGYTFGYRGTLSTNGDIGIVQTSVSFYNCVATP